MRTCDSPRPSGGGRSCRGRREESRQCGAGDCPVSLPPQCGVRVPGSSQFRVVGGVPARLHAHPWIAALGYSEAGQLEYKCGGTLLTSRHVLTAAHCVTAELTTVTLGEHNIKDDEDKAEPESFNISKVIKHEEYNRRTQDNDIAIIRLDREVEFNDGIRPVCLPSESENLREDKVTELQSSLTITSRDIYSLRTMLCGWQVGGLSSSEVHPLLGSWRDSSRS